MNAPSSRLAPLLFAFLACGAAAASVPKYDTAEVVLHSSVPFNGVSGTPNPFTSVTLTLSVTAPDGRAFQVDGFFDGDGAGGAVGDVFKARIFLDQTGTWTWASSSATAGLGGQNGQIVCSGSWPVFSARDRPSSAAAAPATSPTPTAPPSTCWGRCWTSTPPRRCRGRR
jgi:hypothetical protein